MAFVAISIDKYIKTQLENNPSGNEADLRKKLISALKDYNNGVRCACGNDIWVAGSASVGNGCYSCITGESIADGAYEIDSAIKKRDNIKGRRHIDQIDKTQIHGYFDDDGYEINTELIKKPSLCLTCINDVNPNEETLCMLTRIDQKDDADFKCFAYEYGI